LTFDGHLRDPGPEGAANVFQIDGRMDDVWITTAAWAPPGPALAPYPLLKPDQCVSLDYADWNHFLDVPSPTIRHDGGDITLGGDGAHGAELDAVLPVGSTVQLVGMDAEVRVPPDLIGLEVRDNPGGGFDLTWEAGGSDIYLGLYGDLAVLCGIEDDGRATVPVEALRAADPILDADIVRMNWEVGIWEGRSTLLSASQGRVVQALVDPDP
jgi:hypothetical protein